MVSRPAALIVELTSRTFLRVKQFGPGQFFSSHYTKMSRVSKLPRDAVVHILIGHYTSH